MFRKCNTFTDLTKVILPGKKHANCKGSGGAKPKTHYSANIHKLENARKKVEPNILFIIFP